MDFRNKRLMKNRQNKLIAGVCGGIADYLEIDATVIRILWIIFGCFGMGIVAYIVAALIIPTYQD